MSKYNVGDEFIIRIEWKKGDVCEFSDGTLQNVETVKALEKAGGVIRKEKAGNMTSAEAWKIAREITKMDHIKANEIFGTAHTGHIFRENTEHEAKAKIEAWEAGEEIGVGDVIQNIDNPDAKVLITRDYRDGTYNGIDDTGATFSGIRKKHWKKTGRHYDIEAMLKKFREES